MSSFRHGERLSRAAVRTEHVVGSNPTTAKTAVDSLYLNLDARYRRGHSVADSSRHQFLEVNRELVSQLAAVR